MEIIPFEKIEKKEWDDFCKDSNDAWFWHTSDFLEYIVNYKIERNPQNKSFLVKDDNNKAVALCPLFLETDKAGNNFFTFGADYNPNPCLANYLNMKERGKIMSIIFQQVDNLALGYKVKFYNLRLSILADNSFKDIFYYNYLLRYGFIADDVNTTILDLSTDLDKIYASFRHGHRENIRKNSDKFIVDVFTSDCEWDTFKLYKELHCLAAGRETRPIATFKLMHEWVKKNFALLVGVKKEDMYIGFSLFSMYKNKAYYSSSATHPAYNDLPVGHVAIWEAIKYMKGLKVKFFEIGWQEHSNSLFRKVDEKGRNISYFKNGFGGFTKTIFQGVKFYDRKFIAKLNRIC